MTARSITVVCPDCGRPMWIREWQRTHGLTCETVRCERREPDA